MSTTTSPDPPSPRRVALATLIGTTIEWYDFFVYGTAAALVFGRQFFPAATPIAGTLAALSTFAIGFVARPVGGAVAGHLGDRLGRRTMLVASLLVMGVATLAIGLLPTYATIGVAAPVSLTVLRVVQGLGAGGEWGGAVLLSLEHAPPRHRTFYASFPQMGLPVGVVAAAAVFGLVRHGLNDPAFAAWGWRIPFLLSALLVGFGLVVRLRIAESPVFEEVRRHQVRRAPLLDAVRRYPATVLAASGVNVLASAFGNVVLVFTLTYATTEHLLNPSQVLLITIVSALVWAVCIPLSAALADRVGRRRVFLASVVLGIVWAFPYFWLVDTGSFPLAMLAGAIGCGTVGLGGGPHGAFVAEAFPPSMRYSGASVSYGIGSVLGGALVTVVATALLAATGSATAISVYLVVLGTISLMATLALRSPETPAAPPAVTTPTGRREPAGAATSLPEKKGNTT